MSHGFRFGLIYPRTVPRESTPLSFNAVVSFIQKGKYSTFMHVNFLMGLERTSKVSNQAYDAFCEFFLGQRKVKDRCKNGLCC